KVILVVLLVVGLSCGGGARISTCCGGVYSVEQDQIKAVYLYNFLHVVNWPEDRKPTEVSPAMVIGVLGTSLLSAALDDLAESVRKRKGTPLTVVHFGIFKEGMDLSGCRIVFVSDSEKKNFTKITSSLKHASVLTVADSEDFLAAGGMIALVERYNRVRYRINRHAASEAGLRLSSQLLKSALSVDGG
ncbi:MAG: YfiR family protein, partial [Desulfobulbaceae bacterium]|nr:YfiR family protein [Desulfobulbaceae bacterium]